MNQPVYWIVLAGIALLAAAVRLAAGGPLLRRRAVRLERIEFVVAALGLLALAFHCTVMFFEPWTEPLPGGEFLGSRIRALGAFSRWTYWLPAVIVLLALRRVWWPGLALLATTLAGVGITMFWSYPLVTHLAWLAGAVLSVVVVASALLGSGTDHRPASRRAPVRTG